MSPLALERRFFERLVADALDALPETFGSRLDNVEIVVEDWPDAETLRVVGARSRSDLLGFYHGVPQTVRTHAYGLVLPDKISLYQRPIELRCRSLAEARVLVGHVLRHEIAHHFGLDDARLREIETW